MKTTIDLEQMVDAIETEAPIARHVDDRFWGGHDLVMHARHARSVEVMCYSIGRDAPALGLRVTRIIYSVGAVPPVYKTRARKIYNSHAKLWLIDSYRDGKCAFIGSMNFGCPTLLELVYQLPKSYYPAAEKYFNHYWELAKPQ